MANQQGRSGRDQLAQTIDDGCPAIVPVPYMMDNVEAGFAFADLVHGEQGAG